MSIRLVEKCLMMQVATSARNAMHALSFTKIQVLKAQVLAKFIRSDKTSAVTVLGSFT